MPFLTYAISEHPNLETPEGGYTTTFCLQVSIAWLAPVIIGDKVILTPDMLETETVDMLRSTLLNNLLPIQDIERLQVSVMDTSIRN